MSILEQFSLAGRRALVTGSSRGIGYAIARGLGSAGAEIIVNGRGQNRVADASAQLRAEGLSVHELNFDVTDADATKGAIDRFESGTGPIDVLVNNAGMQHRASLEDFPVDKFDELMRTNVNSVFYVSQAAARHMIGRGRGRIINICSVTTLLARRTIAPYSASKGAVANLTKGMAADWARHGLNVNGLAPGFFKTELNAALVADSEFSDWLSQRTPMGRWGDVSELAGAAVYLASDASSFVNGHILYVDGAITATV